MRYSLAIAPLALAALNPTQASEAEPRPDLADLVSGIYAGDVISDARGSSRPDVSVSVNKTAPDTVSVVSGYARIPPRTFRLERVLNTIQNRSGEDVFLFEINKSPVSLMLTIDDAAWAGVRPDDSSP